MFRIAETVTNEDGTVVDHRKSQRRVIDSKGGLTHFATDEARDIEDLRAFPWDDTLTHASNLTLPYAKQP